MTTFQCLITGFTAARNRVLTTLARCRKDLGELGFPTRAVGNHVGGEGAMRRCWVRWVTEPAAFMVTTIKGSMIKVSRLAHEKF